MKRMKGLPETVPIKEVYAAFRAGFYAGCDFNNSRSDNDHVYLAFKRAKFLKKRFNHEVPDML
jgi:hypothetical protein